MRRSKSFFDMKKVKDKTEQCCKKAYICFSKQIIKYICFQNNSFLWKLWMSDFHANCLQAIFCSDKIGKASSPKKIGHLKYSHKSIFRLSHFKMCATIICYYRTFVSYEITNLSLFSIAHLPTALSENITIV